MGVGRLLSMGASVNGMMIKIVALQAMGRRETGTCAFPLSELFNGTAHQFLVSGPFDVPIRMFRDIDFDTIDQRTGLHPSSSKVLGGLSVTELARSSNIICVLGFKLFHQDFEKNTFSPHSNTRRTIALGSNQELSPSRLSINRTDAPLVSFSQANTIAPPRSVEIMEQVHISA